MAHRATQQINSSFGTFAAGHEVPADLPDHVLHAWSEAGIVEHVPEPPVAEQIVEASGGLPPIETATAPAIEKAVAPRQRTHAAPKAAGKPAAPKAAPKASPAK